MAKNAKELLVLTTAAATSYGGYIFYDKMIRSPSSNQVSSDQNADTQMKDQDLVIVDRKEMEKIVKMETEKTRLEKLRSLWFYPYGNPVEKKKDPPLTVPGDAGYKEEQRQKSDDGEES